VEPSPDEAEGKRVTGLRRIGKRIVLELEGELFLVLHLMIAGRLQWKAHGAKIPRGIGLAAFDFPTGSLILTEASPKKRASMKFIRGVAALSEIDPGGVEPLQIDLATFREAVRRENRTLKRLLTDPRLISGIGNAYSDEILHRARLSPIARSARLSDADLERLHEACRETLTEWTDRLREEVKDGWPKKVTAFRPEMAVHGRYGKPCPVCRTPIQRIVYADNETNYCARCQTGGRLLADRSLSRLLKGDRPRRLEELEEPRSGDARE
jgi:formamidopyrimidine-DNA glycosylase